jgi:hypothetical protein
MVDTLENGSDAAPADQSPPRSAFPCSITSTPALIGLMSCPAENALVGGCQCSNSRRRANLYTLKGLG